VEKNGLCAKWMPRPNVTSIENKKYANALKFLRFITKKL
jgi:hypothetical protein